MDRDDSKAAEIWAYMVGLKVYWDASYRKIILETDSMEALDLLRNEPNVEHHVTMTMSISRKSIVLAENGR